MIVAPYWMFAAGFSAVSLLFIVLGLFLLRTGRQIRARNKELQESKTSRIADLQPGTVKVRGTARPIDDEGLVQGVMVEGEGVASSFEIERHDTRGQGNYEPAFTEYDAVPFLVDDGTDEVRVDPPISEAATSPMKRGTKPSTTGQYVLETDEQTVVEVGEDAPKYIQQYEAERDMDSKIQGKLGSMAGWSQRRYSEGFVEPGDEVTVRAEYHEAPAGWDVSDYVLGVGDDPDSFFLSDKPEDAVGTEDSRKATLLYVGGLLVTSGAVLSAVVPWLVWLLL